MAQVMDFAWGISIEKRLQTILEVVGIYGSRERINVALRWGIELEEDYKYSMKL